MSQSKSPSKSVKQIPNSKFCPFKREKSSYRIIWNCLFHYRKRGISKERLLEVVAEQMRLQGIKTTATKILYSVQVVTSARKDRLSHVSIRSASDSYYVDVKGQNYKLHLKKS